MIRIMSVFALRGHVLEQAQVTQRRNFISLAMIPFLTPLTPAFGTMTLIMDLGGL
jgi:hypothetical protein